MQGTEIEGSLTGGILINRPGTQLPNLLELGGKSRTVRPEIQAHGAKFTRPFSTWGVNEKPQGALSLGLFIYSRQRPTLPQSHPCSTIGA